MVRDLSSNACELSSDGSQVFSREIRMSWNIQIYYKSYKIEDEFIEKFNSTIYWIYAYSDAGPWIPVSNSCKSIKEAKAYIRECLR